MSVEIGKQSTVLLPCENDFGRQQLFIDQVRKAIGEGASEILLDCSEVEQVTSTHINMLWKARTICHENDRRFRLLNVTDGLARVLEVLDLKKLFLEPGTVVPKLSVTMSTGALDFSGKGMETEIALTTEDVSRVLKQIRLFVRQLDLAHSYSIEVETIFYEAATNIRLHSGLADTDNFQFSLVVSDHSVRMQFVDKGIPFDSSKQKISYDPVTAATSYRKRGLGLVMIRRMADNIEYERTAGGENVLTLEKSWR